MKAWRVALAAFCAGIIVGLVVPFGIRPLTETRSGPQRVGTSGEIEKEIYESLFHRWGYINLQFLWDNRHASIYKESLRAALNDESSTNRQLATIALFIIRDRPDAMLESLLEDVSGGGQDDREFAASLLKAYFLSEHDPGEGRVIFDVVEPVVRREDTDEPYVPLLLDWMKKHDDTFTVVTIIGTLRHFVDNPGVVPALLSALDSPTEEVRREALQTLTTIRRESEVADDPRIREAVLGAMKDPDPLVRGRACRILGLLVPSDETIAAVKNALLAPDADVKSCAARSIVELLPPSDALTVLMQAFDEPVVNHGVIVALGKLGPEAAIALPRLRELESSSDKTTSIAAHEAIKGILGCND